MTAIVLDKPEEQAYPNWINAASGFKQIGFHVIHVKDVYNIPIEYRSRESIPLGGIGFIESFLDMLDVDKPLKIDYPNCLTQYLNRKTWVTTINQVQQEEFPVFIKPYEHEKLFTGKVISDFNDLIGCYNQEENYKVLCSEPVKFVSEYRGYVQFDKLVDCRFYKGDFRKTIDFSIVEEAVNVFKDSHPIKYDAYSIDFGLTNRGETSLIELNDAYALGNYGLIPLNYAKFLLTRWTQLVDIYTDLFLTII